MKKIDDEQIQQLIERGDDTCRDLRDDLRDDQWSDDEKAKIAAYRQLFKNLEHALPGGLSVQFAAKVSARVQKEVNRKRDIRFYIGSLLIFSVSLAAGAALLYLVNDQAGSSVLQIVSRFKWMFAFASLLFLIIQIADQKMVKEV